MARKSNKLKGFKATDGALAPEDVKQEVAEAAPKKRYRNLAEIMGEDIDVSNTTEFNDYSTKIRSMNMADLYEHSIKAGLLPVDNRNKLIDRLEKNWLKNNAKYKDVQVVQEVPMDEKKKKELKDILSPSRI